MTAYIALLRKDATSDYGVEFPDFPGCITAGSSLEEARLMAAEVLGLHIEGMIEDGEAVPNPTDLDKVMADQENSSAIAFMVDAPIDVSRVVRVNITMPEDLLHQIDRTSPNRSRFLANAARQLLGTHISSNSTTAVRTRNKSIATKARGNSKI